MPATLQPRPMLAAKYDRDIVIEHLKGDGFLFMQPKIDGMRVLFDNGVARSRSWKPWTNQYLQNFAQFHDDMVHGWDGEMLPGLLNPDVPDPEVFRKAMSGLRSADGASQMTYFLFDNWDDSWRRKPYQTRLAAVNEDLRPYTKEITDSHLTFRELAPLGTQYMFEMRVVLCPTKPVYSIEEVEQTHLEFVAAGWEGSILRRALAPYKWNRATAREGWLTKMKDFEDGEAVIEDFEPAYENLNQATTSLLGYTTRSAHQANLRAKDYLGAWIVHLHNEPSVRFKIGVLKGFTLDDRRKLLKRAEAGEMKGKIIKFTHQGYSGGYDAPRTPVMVGFRDAIDL